MKIRNGFVSNSSSSSFVCVVCGSECSGMDMCLSDAEMSRCENDHTFCDSHKVKVEDTRDADWKCPECEEGKDDCFCDEDDTDERYDIPAKFCPICQFQAIATEEGFAYLLKKAGMTAEQLLEEVKTTFKNYDDYVKFWGK